MDAQTGEGTENGEEDEVRECVEERENGVVRVSVGSRGVGIYRVCDFALGGFKGFVFPPESGCRVFLCFLLDRLRRGRFGDADTFLTLGWSLRVGAGSCV